ncbi:MAG: T9SS type A sorting domain-containing protein [Bacteroidota bacterium]|nr:T9SS type A sorting domain-containing protein [Bacteroidota bacterium]
MNKGLMTMILFCAGAISSLNAQITINRSDFPVLGTLTVRAVDTTAEVSPGPSGLNVTWNFSNLSPNKYDSVYWVAPDGLPFYQDHPGANIAEDIIRTTNPPSYEINFMNLSDTGYMCIGNEILTSFPNTGGAGGYIYMAMHYSYLTPACQITFPFTYGDSCNGAISLDLILAYRFNGVIMDTMYGRFNGTVSIVADASGEMITPYGNYPVIRVREKWVTTDSSYTWENNNWVFASSDTSIDTVYRWYANDYGQVGYWNENSKKSPGGFTFFKSQTYLGTKNLKPSKEFYVYPNPAVSKINIISKDSFDGIEITDNTGKIRIRSGNQKTIDVSTLASGMYIIRILNGDKSFTEKFFKQ